MPKDTFHNLQPEKQQMIEDVAFIEFAEYGYDNASVNRIVEQCKIAKGSFYQYFDDKKDLFLHLVERISEKKLEFMSPKMQNPEEHDFFTLIEELYTAGLQFAASNPQIATLGNWIYKNMDHWIVKEMYNSLAPKGQDIYQNLINLAISRGEIRPDIDIKFISYVLVSITTTMVEYYFINEKDGKADFRNMDESLSDTVKLFMDLIKNGIGV